RVQHLRLDVVLPLRRNQLLDDQVHRAPAERILLAERLLVMALDAERARVRTPALGHDVVLAPEVMRVDVAGEAVVADVDRTRFVEVRERDRADVEEGAARPADDAAFAPCPDAPDARELRARVDAGGELDDRLLAL